MSLVMGIDLSIVNEESVKHQFIKKIILGAYKKYGKIVFVKSESEYGFYEKEEQDSNVRFYKTLNPEDSIILERQENFDLKMEQGFYLGSKRTPLKPDLVFWDFKNGKPHTIIEIINTSAPSAEKYEAYCEADVNYISIFIKNKNFDINHFFDLIDGQEKNILRYPIKCTQIIKNNLTPGEKISEILKGITGYQYQYVGYLKDFEDLPFIFNKEENSIDFFPHCRPNFNTFKYVKSCNPIKGSYELRAKKIPKLLQSFIMFNKNNFNKEIIEEQYFKKGFPSNRVDSILRVKIKKIIKKFDEPFLCCDLIDFVGDDVYGNLKGKPINIIYKNNDEEPVSADKVYYFKTNSGLYKYKDTYKVFSEKIVPFELYNHERITSRIINNYELFYLPILKNFTGDERRL